MNAHHVNPVNPSRFAIATPTITVTNSGMNNISSMSMNTPIIPSPVNASFIIISINPPVSLFL